MIRSTNHLRMTFTFIHVLFICLTLAAQDAVNFRQVVNKNVVDKWKPIALSDLSSIKITPPPGAKQTALELTEVKNKTEQVGEPILQQIHFWDAGSPAYRWNEIASSIVTFENVDAFFRFPSAWMNLAIYDATLATWKAKYMYNRKRPFEADPSITPWIAPPSTPSYPCEHTVTAAAAATVLGYFYPASADSFLNLARQSSQSRIYAGLQYPSDIEEGWKLGEQVAKKIIEKAKNDASGVPFKGQIPNDPKFWHGDFPVGIQVRNYKPIFMKSCDQLRPPAPPDFAKEMKEMKEFKQDFNSTYLALRWAALSGFDIWNELASKKIFEEHLDRNTPYCARIYALMHAAMYDASIAIMDAKYAYWGIRPNQYDTSYKPLIFTPPFPGYPSGHATASATAATVLSYFFPSDKAFFEKTAKECADSRFYGGIHFRTDNETGLQLGNSLANYVIDTWINKEELSRNSRP